MFVRGENGFFYLHDDQGRILQVVGDGMTWIYQYHGADRANVVLHGPIPQRERAYATTLIDHVGVVGVRVTYNYDLDGHILRR